MLTGSRHETMLGLVRRVALPMEAPHGEAVLGWEAILRRLAAIGAADVPGYWRLIEADEGALARPGNLPHCLIDPKLALPTWRTLETTGAVAG